MAGFRGTGWFLGDDRLQSGGDVACDSLGSAPAESSFGTDEVGVIEGLDLTRRSFGSFVKIWLFHET